MTKPTNSLTRGPPKIPLRKVKVLLHVRALQHRGVLPSPYQINCRNIFVSTWQTCLLTSTNRKFCTIFQEKVLQFHECDHLYVRNIIAKKISKLVLTGQDQFRFCDPVFAYLIVLLLIFGFYINIINNAL